MRSARVGHRFEQVGKTLQGGFAQQALGLLFAERREDTLACDTIHERRLLERRVGLLSLSYLSWEASLSNNSQALGRWECTLDRQVRRFHNVTTIEEYLEKRNLSPSQAFTLSAPTGISN